MRIDDPVGIEAFLRRDVFLNIYAIGDLDDFFRPFTTWYALRDGEGGTGRGEIRRIVLLYTASAPPTLLALARERTADMRAFLRALLPLLPDRFYAHLSEGLSDGFAGTHAIDSHGLHHKMGLTDPSRLDGVDTSAVVPLATADRDDLTAFYDASYPGHWFEPRRLETVHYYGVREAGRLVGAGGVHVCSDRYRVAALGNIATAPDRRGRGIATAVTARVCRSLRPTVEWIGLNVHVENRAAIACYENLGFERIATYEECLLDLLPPNASP